MGFMLKEVLKALCSGNQWCYSVFWKIGCQNTKLLIWEECYYQPTPLSELPFGEWEGRWGSSEVSSSQHGFHAGDRVQFLINQMMINNQVNLVGEGIVGRAAFTGNHQWILANNHIRDSHPPEIQNEVQFQFSSGMQTVAVIPILPHGVVQLGSTVAITENTGFVNYVKSLIMQLGCVPGALLSENYGMKDSAEKVGVPVSNEVLVSLDPSGIYKVANSTSLLADSYNQQSSSSQPSGLVGQHSDSVGRQIQHNAQATASTFRTPNLTQTFGKSHDDHCKQKLNPVMKPNLHFRCQPENGVVGAEVIPSNPDAWLQQQASLYNSRPEFSYKSIIGQPSADFSSLKLIEQQVLTDVGVRDPVIKNVNASNSNSFVASHLRKNGGLTGGSLNTPLLEASEPQGGMSSQITPVSVPSSIANPSKSADYNLYCTNPSSVVDQLTTSHILSGGSSRGNSSSDFKRTQNDSASKKQGMDNELYQALNSQFTHPDGHNSLSGQIPGYVHDCRNHVNGDTVPSSSISKFEDGCSQPPSGDDLFDILGVDFKNKLLSGKWDNFLVDGQNLDKGTVASMNVLDVSSDFNSVNQGISDSATFSGMGTEHLLDAVVSRAHTATKQISDDNLSCKTTVTKISSSSIPSSSPSCGRTKMSDPVQGEFFGLPKSMSKAGTVASGSFQSAFSKDDAGSCSQTTSIYSSQIGSWVDQGNSAKCAGSVSTAYSKRNNEMTKPNRKRLKPGENPRPRPKDRQMIQDRVKELREIVPNGAKCSIDALLERTIKHMLFLQSVTKHADKLKQTGESKIINNEGGLLLKDNFEGGATWAFEVGSQSMVCPIIVEDLNPPRQMLVEMLCEERGFFLEIADIIRGLGLTILKGVMEARNDKIWARFAVEANRDVTRMEIFMSLVRLLEQTVKGSTLVNALENNNMMVHHSFPQATSIPATGRPSSLQ
ncbi:hypothetical protein EZV62_002109 [Acer yangbiense]|uniref:BHLH domain-containing protein n=1 Tax=Acer yangbiense TaxID=1000413 RepID=A0A5C7IW51_9ROSI|nr:hypothetical protein EZV62_002109 [Acer yangbiense]